MAAAQRENFAVAAQYLDTTKRQDLDGATLAMHLAYILNRRLPTHLNEISNKPQGSQVPIGSLLRESLGSITTSHADVDITLERVTGGDDSNMWLFSRETVAAIPRLYKEISAADDEPEMPEFLLNKLFGIMVFGWLTFFVGLPVAYLLLSAINRLVSAAAAAIAHRVRDLPSSYTITLLPPPLRLLILSFFVHWSISKLSLPLLSRHFWSGTTVVLALIGCVWLFMWLTKKSQEYCQSRLLRQNQYSAVSLLRPTRTVINIIAMVLGLFIGLYSFGLNPMAAIAGLGVGGIAVALAAQKTLENVIGGVSLIADRALRVGDFLKTGDIQGTVEQIGLRSTQVRTLARTVVSIPNGQMATVALENFSFRDLFGFRHLLAVQYDTSAFDLSGTLDDIRVLFQRDARVSDREPPRVRFIGFGQFGFQVELFAYISAADFPEFLRIQEDLLLQILRVLAARGLQPAHQVPLFGAAPGSRVQSQHR